MAMPGMMADFLSQKYANETTQANAQANLANQQASVVQADSRARNALYGS